MIYDEILQNVAILGSAGKMGSGIVLLTCVEMADLSLKPENKDKTFVLNAIDISQKALSGLMIYLRSQVFKIAEKKIIQLRNVYKDRADLIENSEIIDQYVFDVLNIVRPSVNMEAAYQSTLIFEAVNENEDLKVKLYKQIDINNPNKPWFFTNTSSVPIHILNEKAHLEGRIVGFHFYNPPAVQKLVELIKADKTLNEVNEFALQYAKKLKKVVVPSNDIAGFIGNGHFMRDILYSASKVAQLTEKYSFVEAVYIENKISQEYLVRPMGIFQLIDYVGVDVCQFILNVMNKHIEKETLNCPLIDDLMQLGVKGGQNHDGSQKDGILKYEKGKITAVYDIKTKTYVPLEKIQPNADEAIGSMLPSTPLWKNVVAAKNKDEIFTTYFKELNNLKTFGAQLAMEYAHKSKQIGLDLIANGVANNADDVNTVLLTGFFHAYGPINNYID